MKIPDLYVDCPIYTTKNFTFRLVEEEDAKDLLVCYSDPEAVAHMNADNCNNDFYYDTLDKMKENIKFWLEAYHVRAFVRLAVLPLEGEDAKKAVGTIELFGGEYGVLRIDLASTYEKPEVIEEIVKFAIDHLVGPLEVQTLVIKADNVPNRVDSFKKFGFVPSDFRTGGYMEWKRKSTFRPELGFAVCGLACCLCSENATCSGCREKGCPDRDWCKGYHCWTENGTKSCAECKDFPCDFMMLNKVKTKAIFQFIKDYGEEKLLKNLERNEAQGINYHYLGEYDGDYDCNTVEEAYDLMLNGWE